MDEEAQKRNTDCVYFLASPLTCKKGNSCEFRHSEAARMNPRDCWYWIHSTCRNPNCSFRHPPLEGKLASSLPPQASVSAAATAPTASPASMPAAALSSKSKTPCYFFSQGHCAKGDKCPFMHGPSLPSGTDTVTQQKPPKAPHAEGAQASNKPVVVLKGYSSNAVKQARQENPEKRSVGHSDADAQPVSIKVPTLSSQVVHPTVKELERSRILESSVTSNAYRSEQLPGSRKSRTTLFSDTAEEFLDSVDRRHDMRGPAEKVRQDQLGRKLQLQSQHEDERSHSFQTADHRYQNGSRSDVWWKNESSSLDGDASDESIQREDGEYSPRQGSRGRSKMFDDPTGYGLKTSKSYGQLGSDSAALQHRQPRYQQHREQQLGHGSDYNGAADHTRHHGFPSSARTSARDAQRLLSEGYNTVDLRDHLLKRRRDDKGHYPRNESLPRRVSQDVIDTPHFNQRWDDALSQHDQQGRATYRRADYRGAKRPRHDGGASPDGRLRGSPIKRLGPGKSPDRVVSLGSPNRHSAVNYSRGEERERGRDRYSSRTEPVSDAKSHLTSSKSVRSEYVKEEDSGFTGPKSLAQIKAEKMVEGDCDVRVAEGRSRKGKYLEGSGKYVDATSFAPTKSRDSTAPTSRHKRSRPDSTSVEDFEGPKPLSMLLKEKQKLEPGPGNSVEEGMRLPNKTIDSGPADLHREMEDGEVRDEEDDWKDDHSHYTDSPIAPLQEEVLLRSRLESDSNIEDPVEEGNSQGVDEGREDIGSSEDEMRLGVDVGQTMSGDEEYGLDDDEDDDDFAKKLGGFFS